MEIYFDGTLKKRVTGRDAIWGRLPIGFRMMKMGLYGDYAVGKSMLIMSKPVLSKWHVSQRQVCRSARLLMSAW